MRRLLVPLALALLAFAPATARAEVRGSLLMHDGWEFADQAEGPWQTIEVPHVMDPEPTSAVWAGRVAWYRLRFQGPKTQDGHAWSIRFDQVRRRADVFLNGREIGTNSDPYTPFTLPARGLQPGKENVLVVRVDNRRTPGWREGWWNWGGITRAVHLVPRGRVELRDTGLLSEVSCEGVCRAQVRLDTWLTNRTGEPVRPLVAVRVQGPDGTTAQRTMRVRSVAPGETARVQFGVPVEHPELWTPERPALYDATVQARIGRRVEHAEQSRVGLRTVTVDDGRLELNGRALDLRGTSIQEDVAGRGPALTDGDVEEIVRELKSVGANVTRAHYLLDDRLLDRLDEEGILVWSQAPVYHRDAQLKTPGQRSHELGVVRNTILADRNHASVVTHSVANELTAQPDTKRTSRVWLENAAALAHDLDPTLPVSIDILSYPRIPRQTTYDAYDMLGINSYYGWYEGKLNRSTADIDDLAPYLRTMRAKYPRKALVITEYGAEATGPGPAAVKQTYAFQADYIKRNLDIVDRLGFMGGAIYWTTREFAVKPFWDGGAHPPSRDSIHNKGLISYGGKVKPAFAVVQKEFKATPLYRDDPQAVARAQLSEPRSLVLRTLLLVGVLGGVLGLLVLDAWCLRAIWRSWRPQGEGQVVPLRRAA
ncbi:MAG TPA: glycoside hydrolase family 2 TIM barrel-domain containing protein [Solirubrobacteraceae bacterium]